MISYQTLRVFLSSPSDVAQERRLAEQVVRAVSNTCRDTLGISLDCIHWETMPPITPTPPRTIQQTIEDEVRQCTIFVLVLNKRYGSVEPGHTKSNTEREVETALSILASGQPIIFLSYFRRLAANNDPGQQENKVRELRQRLEAKRIWHREFETPDEFKDALTHDLYNAVIRFRVSARKQIPLRAFWDLGIAEGHTQPKLAIIYPPVDRNYMPNQQPDRIWLHRLAPHIVFEDFKAIMKITKTLRLVGLRDFHPYGTANVPADLRTYNHVWLCVPRNKLALKCLRSKYEQTARFRFERVSTDESPVLRWRFSTESANWIIVRSPLNQYLAQQRSKQPGGLWRPQHSTVVAKDFAIIARLADSSAHSPTESGIMKDYFIAGIRGLGTWGAAWMLDRRYSLLAQFVDQPTIDIQILLEVLYVNGQIDDVRDVSAEPEAYFDQQNRKEIVKDVINEHGNV